MPRTAEIKLRIDPELKTEAAKLYQQWGLNLTDAVTIFLSQSVAYGGLPFDMRQPNESGFDWSNPKIIRKDKKTGKTLLPSEWDAAEDSAYDNL